ncbi:probable trehalase isoform X5 [Physcomitrium patens]|nr:probable trehalase isoform X5 [Physcomitrium patens]|eukprot:XP_024398910.1 probable trehalase isoform X5 [Physcomitrella patens]
MPILLKEYAFWTSGRHEVKVRDNNGDEHRLSRFWANWDAPRPESFTIDVNVTQGMSKSREAQLYHDIATAAESGWDFSSRWMEDGQNLKTLRTSKIIPVDLNAYLFQMEKNIEYFAKILGNQTTEMRFAIAAKDRQRAIQKVLWNRKKGQWYDVWLHPNRCSYSETDNRTVVFEWKQKRRTYISNFIPLWAGILPKGDVRKEKVIEALLDSGLVLPAGVATSLKNTGQQWDFPNAWAPMVDMIIEGLEASGFLTGKLMAKNISRNWLRSNYVAYEQVGKMVEKYDATSCGKIGGGGEYNPQVLGGVMVLSCLFCTSMGGLPMNHLSAKISWRLDSTVLEWNPLALDVGCQLQGGNRYHFWHEYVTIIADHVYKSDSSKSNSRVLQTFQKVNLKGLFEKCACSQHQEVKRCNVGNWGLWFGSSSLNPHLLFSTSFQIMLRCRCNSCMGHVVLFPFEPWNLNCPDPRTPCHSSSIMIRISTVKNREYKPADTTSVAGNNAVQVLGTDYRASLSVYWDHDYLHNLHNQETLK